MYIVCDKSSASSHLDNFSGYFVKFRRIPDHFIVNPC
jgi:hypothetical protein